MEKRIATSNNSQNNGIQYINSPFSPKDWFVVKSNELSTAYKTHPISSVISSSISFYLFFIVEARPGEIQPILQLKCRSKKIKDIPREITLNSVDKLRVTKLSSFQSEPVQSIIHDDYVSSILYPIKEECIIDAFNDDLHLELVFNGERIILPLEKSYVLSYSFIKRELAPELLTTEQEQRLNEEERIIREETKRVLAEGKHSVNPVFAA